MQLCFAIFQASTAYLVKSPPSRFFTINDHGFLELNSLETKNIWILFKLQLCFSENEFAWKKELIES